MVKRLIPYDQITGVEVSRGAWVDDGVGPSYVLWGTACVLVHLKRGTVKIGTDDAEALVAFLEARTGQGRP